MHVMSVKTPQQIYHRPVTKVAVLNFHTMNAEPIANRLFRPVNYVLLI